MRGWLRNLPNSTIFWLTVLGILLVCSVLLPAVGWGWLRSGASEGQLVVTTGSTSAVESSGPTESNSTTVRNIGFIIAGALALVFAVWRGVLSQRQAKTAEGQAKTALRQTETAQIQVETSQRQAGIAQQVLLNERYQRGAEMLGSGVNAVRLGGIYALHRLAEEHPEEYHIQIMKVFCSFVRKPASGESDQAKNGNEATELREDVQAIMTAIGERGSAGLAIENEVKFTLDLRGADLSFARLSGANLEKSNLTGAKLRSANFFETHFIPPDPSEPIPTRENQPQARPILVGEHVSPDLAGMEDRRANLSLCILTEADLHGAYLLGANLSGAQLMRANLSESQIMYATLRRAVLLGANLSGAFMVDTDLSGAQLGGANLENAVLSSAKLLGADFFGASLNGANFSNAVLSEQNGKYVAGGLTQTQLDQVTINMDNPPDLTGVVQVGSREPLVWNARPSIDET